MLDKTDAPSNARWTKDREEQLIKLWADGLFASEIGRKLGVSRCSVLGKVSRLKLPKRRDDKRQEYTQERRVGVQLARKILNGTAKKPSGPLPDTPIAPDFLGLTFSDLQDNQCHYPKGREPPFLYCGQPAVIGSYCLHCHVITHRLVTEQQAERIFEEAVA